jgi:RNA polymerase sigma factor (sigma-70 family)
MAAEIALADTDFSPDEVTHPVLSDADFDPKDVIHPVLTDADFSPDDIQTPPPVAELNAKPLKTGDTPSQEIPGDEAFWNGSNPSIGNVPMSQFTKGSDNLTATDRLAADVAARDGIPHGLNAAIERGVSGIVEFQPESAKAALEAIPGVSVARQIAPKAVDSLTRPVGKAVADLATGLTSAPNIAGMVALGGAPAVIEKLAMAGFTAQGAHGIYEQGKAIANESDPEKRIEGIAALVLNTAMVAAGAKGLMPKSEAIVPELPGLRERRQMQTARELFEQRKSAEIIPAQPVVEAQEVPGQKAATEGKPAEEVAVTERPAGGETVSTESVQNELVEPKPNEPTQKTEVLPEVSPSENGVRLPEEVTTTDPTSVKDAPMPQDEAAGQQRSGSLSQSSQEARIHEETGLPLNEDGTVSLYHGTTAESANAIRKTGIVKSAAEPDVYFTTSKDGGGYGDGTVIEVRVDPDKLQLDDEFPDGRKDFRIAVGPKKDLPVKLPPESRAPSTGAREPLSPAAEQAPSKPQSDTASAPPAGEPLTAEVIANQTARISGIVDDIVQAGGDRIVAETHAHKMIDAANASGKPVDWQRVRLQTFSEAKKRLAEYRGGGAEKVELDAKTKQGTTVGETIPARDSEQVIRDVRSSVAELPSEQREVVDRILDGMSQREIAEELGIAPQRVHDIYAEAKSELRRRLGPGAANIEEPLAVYEERAFGKRFVDDKSIAPEIREATGNRYYEPIPNKVTVADAEGIIDKRGIEESVKLVRDELTPIEPRVRATIGQSLIKKLNKAYSEAKATGDTVKAEKSLNDAVDTAEYLSELGTKLGQGVQAFAIWSRLTPEGILLAAKRTVKKSREKIESTNGSDITEIIDTVNGAPKGEKLQVLIQLGKKNPIAKKLKGKFKDISEASENGELDRGGFYDIASVKLGLDSITPEQVGQLKKMAIEIADTPEGFQRNEKITDMLSFISKIKGTDASEIPTAIYYANILSGYSTQLVNTIDTAINVFSEAATSAASHPSAVPDIISGLYCGLIKGGIEAKSVLTTGRGRTENKLQTPAVLERTVFGREGGVPISEKTAFGRVMKSALESKPATILNLWKYPLRAMVASDTVFYHSMKEARSRILARVIAKDEGLSGNALFRRVDEILNRTPERIEEARKQAVSEGLTGNRLERRVNEIEEQGRPDELVSSADEAAAIATYNHNPSGIVGLIATKIGEITQNAPIAKMVVPFTRIVANVTNRGLNYTPWGYKRLFFGQHGGERFATEPPVGEAYRTQLIKATAGTIGMSAVAALDAAGTIQITSLGPSDGDERKQLQESGWKPYSVKIGGTWYSYQYTPFNLGFAIIGHYRDAIRYNKLSEKDASTRLGYGLLKAGSTIMDMSFLSGLSNFMETVNGSASSTKSAGKLFSRTVTSIAIPNLVKQIDRLFDPTAYEANSITEALIRETPVARSIGLRPILNALGEPVKMSNNRFFNSEKPDPVWKLIVRKQAFVPIPSKTTKIGNRAITPDEYYQLIQESGPQIRGFIEAQYDRLDAMTDEQAQDAIQDRAKEIRASVKKTLSR